MKLRKLWHHFFYALAGPFGAQIALRCRDVAQSVDLKGLHDPNVSIVQKFQINLHLSLCQACHNYAKDTLAVSKASQKVFQHQHSTSDLSRLKGEVIKKIHSES